MDIVQSAYRKYHSTETALLRVQNDIMYLDKSNTVMLILLDLSATFDTIDHKVLFKRMEQRCGGIKGNILTFLKSYLTEWKEAKGSNR